MSYSDLRKGRHSSKNGIYFITFVVKDRRNIFSDFNIARMYINCMRASAIKMHVTIIAWVVMPDHVHLLLQIDGNRTQNEIMKHLKGYSARTLNKTIELVGQLWQESYYDYGLRSEKEVKPLARYIVANPLRAKLVTSINDYPHWDCIYL